jgi:hypothetical protein
MKTEQIQCLFTLAAALVACAAGTVELEAAISPGSTFPHLDPRFNTWIINSAGTVASVRLKDGEAAKSEWKAIDEAWLDFDPASDPNPTMSGVLADITMIRYDSSHIYLFGSGLASYVMGPWYRSGSPNGRFEFRPIDRSTARTLTWNDTGIGRVPYVKMPLSSAKAAVGEYPTGLGQIGLWVNGTSVYNPMAGDSYANGEVVDGLGVWNTDAYWQEGETFDYAGFHQTGPGSVWGQHHAHINPVALRWQLGDHVVVFTDLDKVDHYVTTSPLGKHSPILGWAYDGYPIYGPYGYNDPNNSSSSVRLMRSGYVLRNGKCGSRNLYSTGRDELPYWATVLPGHKPSAKGPSPGPNWWTPSNFPLGCFVEDWDYRGDLPGGGIYGKDWDLDACNARWCATPEFPNGTYAYFVSLNDAVKELPPQFPYIIGPSFRGKPTATETGVLPLGLSVYF